MDRVSLASFKPDICYFVCATARSGSTYFCDLLKNTKVAGNPFDHYLPQVIAENTKAWNIPEHDLVGYTGRLMEVTETGNRVFGVKIMWPEFVAYVVNGICNGRIRQDARIIDSLSRVFPNPYFIYVKRLDRIGQAVSLAIANQSNIWHKTVKNEIISNKDVVPVKKIKFNHRQIDRALSDCSLRDSQWMRFFRENNIKVFEVIYEELMRDPDKIVRDALEFLGVKNIKDIQIRTDLQRLSRQYSWIYTGWTIKYKFIKIFWKPASKLKQFIIKMIKK